MAGLFGDVPASVTAGWVVVVGLLDDGEERFFTARFTGCLVSWLLVAVGLSAWVDWALLVLAGAGADAVVSVAGVADDTGVDAAASLTGVLAGAGAAA